MLSAPFIKDDQSVTRSIAGETVIVPVRSNVGDLNSIYTLNEAGSRIWQLIDGRTRADQVVAVIVQEYDVAADEATRDVNDFLANLEAAGLIRPAEQAEG